MSMGVGKIFTFQRLQQETASSFFFLGGGVRGGGSGQSWALRRAFMSSGLAESSTCVTGTCTSLSDMVLMPASLIFGRSRWEAHSDVAFLPSGRPLLPSICTHVQNEALACKLSKLTLPYNLSAGHVRAKQFHIVKPAKLFDQNRALPLI